MTTIGFLACETTVPSSGERRGDAYEHDLMVAALEPAFADRGLALKVIDWEAPPTDFEDISLALLGTVWNYQDKPDDFVSRLEALEARGIAVCNPSEIVRWNATKTYLQELAENGAATVPTLWRHDAGIATLNEAFEHFDCDRLVVKRQVGAGALDQLLIERTSMPAPDWRYGHAAMIQPFLPAIAEEGELSFVFVEGELSHALRKRPANGDYRIQSLYGSTESDFDPTSEQMAEAQAVLDKLPFETPLYARIDMLADSDGALMVMEAELIEPYLYPEQGPELGDRLARAIAKRVAKT